MARNAPTRARETAGKPKRPSDSAAAGEVAIVGCACRLPGAASVDAFWRLLAEGRCAVTSIPPDRWSLERLGHPRVAERGRSYTWAAGCLDDIWGFDPGAFGMSPREAEMTDPQQRLLLELTWEALEDAGIRPSTIAGSDTGVFAGVSGVDHSTLRMLDMASADAYMMTGNTLSIVANRISYIFDLHGPSFIVDTACSSALVALNEAVTHLRAGRIDTAIVAGVGLLATPHSFIGFSQAAMLSRRGLCQAFSAEADGYVRAEGGVVLVLQTREAAERQGQAIRGSIVATDVNSDGRTNGISLPSQAYQAALLDKIYVKGGLDPDRLAFFEAHGTGTPVGDPIEAAAIGEILGRRRLSPLPIGSVKTNIGHMEAAAGLGGLLKAMLALEHDVLPPSLHCATPNPAIDFGGLNLEIARQPLPLPGRGRARRLAGVNSFGFGGTNAHVVLADAPPPGTVARPATAPRLFAVSAHARAALDRLAASYADLIGAADEAEAAAIMSAAVHKRDLLAHRVVIPVAGQAEVAATLARVARGNAEGVARGTIVERDAPVAFVFSGNGSQFAGMGVAAYRHNAAFRDAFDALSSAFEDIAGWSLTAALHSDTLVGKLKRAEFAQPLLFALQSATVQALATFGLAPDMVLGHSVGEVAAAEAAGILDRAGALRTILSRSRLQEPTFGRGDMAVLVAAPDVAEELLAAVPGLVVAAFNSPRAITVSGAKEQIGRLADLARAFPARVRKLNLDYPFHSPLMRSVEGPLKRSLADLPHGSGPVPFVSTVTGGMLAGDAMTGDYWWRNVREPVLFTRAVAEAVRAGGRIFVEIGPTPILLSHINDTVDERAVQIATVASLDKRDGDPIALAAATAIARGARFDRHCAFGPPPPPGRRTALPTYPWQRTTYRLPDTVESASDIRPGPWHPLVGARAAADRLDWRATLDTTAQPSLADHVVGGQTILPGAAFAEMALAVARDWLGCDAAAIADLEISSPMTLTADSARDVLCRVSAPSSHIEIFSRPRLANAPWHAHAIAKILHDAGASPAPGGDGCGFDRPAGAVAGAAVYEAASLAGLSYGPSYRKLAWAARVGEDRIAFALAPAADGADAFGLDPARLDACFHALVLVFAGGGAGAAYVPVRFGEIVLHRPGATFTCGRIDLRRHDERFIVADFLLQDDAGQAVAAIRDARFQALRAPRSGEAAHTIVRRRTVLAAEPTAARLAPPIPLAALRRGLFPTGAGRRSARGGAAGFMLLEGWATSVALAAVRRCARDGIVIGGAIAAGWQLPALGPWIEDILSALEHSGLARRNGGAFQLDMEAALPGPDEILRTIAGEHQDLSAELLVATATTVALDALEAGAPPRDGTLAPKILDAFELGSAFAHAAADRLLAGVRHSLDRWPGDRALRVLQVGFGPASARLAALAAPREARITLFDPDRRRLERARASLSPAHGLAFVDQLVDAPAASFDLVAGSLQRARGRHLAGIRRVMARDAVFVAVEPAPCFFRLLTLGLDGALAADKGETGGAREAEAWQAQLQALQFAEAEVRGCDLGVAPALIATARADGERRRPGGGGTVLIVGEGCGATALATLLASSGPHVALVAPGETDGRALGDEAATVVVFAEPLTARIEPAQHLARLCLELKRLAATVGARAATLWLVCADGGSEGIAAGLCAFSRTLANEAPNLDIRRVTGSATPEALAERLRDLVLSDSVETDIELTAEATRVVRFEAAAGDARSLPAQAARLVRGEGSGMDRLQWQAVDRRPPGADEVEIAVEAIGLNFRDVMFGLGLLPEDVLEHGFAGPTLGLECAGRVERVGRAVKRFKLGDRVMGFARHAFATHATTPAAVVAPIPQDLGFEMAATVPVAFLTAYHGLVTCARLQADEWVLIHGGAGGVGLAALQIARWRGARVIATAGSPERRALLRALGAEHAFDSRSGAFVEDVRRVAGAGVAVVLNSLSGEAMERSIGVLRPFGRFVELGKRDYVANTHVGLRPFRRNLSYFGVDLDQLLAHDPTASRRLMRSVMRLFATGHLAALPYRAFAGGEAIDAFRLMQQSGHVGKLVVRPPDPASVSRTEPRAFRIEGARTILVTGGLGGFGLATARWLAAHGARHLTLVSRSGAGSSEARDGLADLAAAGVDACVVAADAADPAEMSQLFGRFGVDLPRLGGVVHAAMVLDDGLISNLTAEALERVLRPKVAGAAMLDRLTRNLDLDLFVLYSSATTLVGNPGQGAYVAANGYLEGLARDRRRLGLPGLAVAWGAIADVGVLARSDGLGERLAERAGVKAMPARAALDRLGRVLAASSDAVEDAVVAIADIAWQSTRRHLATTRAPAFAGLMSDDEHAAEHAEKIDIARLVREGSADAARTLVADLILDELARVLRLPRDDVSRTTPLAEIGVDSLMAVELALGLGDRFVLDAPLAASASSFTIETLTDHIVAMSSDGAPKNDVSETIMSGGHAAADAVGVARRHLDAGAIANLAASAEDLKRKASAVQARSRTLKGIFD